MEIPSWMVVVAGLIGGGGIMGWMTAVWKAAWSTSRSMTELNGEVKLLRSDVTGKFETMNTAIDHLKSDSGNLWARMQVHSDKINSTNEAVATLKAVRPA